MMKKQNGITLIALVITIIVLLILAGVSIAMLTGDNGILTKAGDAKTNSQAAEAEEALKLAVNVVLADKLDPTVSDDAKKEITATSIKNANNNDNVTLEANSANDEPSTGDGEKTKIGISAKINDTTYQFKVDTSTGKVEKVSQ